MYFTKFVGDHRIPTNTDINEKTMNWNIRSKWNMFEVYVFTFRKNSFLHLGKTMKLRIC